jgi:TCP-1/cpn60 chaperonin family
MEFFRELEAMATVVLNQKCALLVIDSKMSVSNYSSFTSSPMKFLDKDGAIRCDDDALPLVFQRLISSNNSGLSGWFLVLLTCKLIISGFQSKLQISSISRGFTSAAMAAVTEISPKGEKRCSTSSNPSVKINWDDLDGVLSIIKTSVGSHHVLQLTEREISTLSISILTAFLSSVDRDSMKCSIIYRRALGLPIENLIVLENTLAMDISLPHDIQDRQRFKMSQTHNRFQKLIVAIFENSLELSELSNYSLEIDRNAEQTEPGGKRTSIKSLEYKFLDGIAHVLTLSKVTLVACQRRIHPYLVRILKKVGIICLPRLSIRYCGALQRLCGARQLVSFPITQNMICPLDPSSLGYLSSLECRTIYGRNYVVACSGTESTASTSDEPCSDAQESFTVSAFGQDCALGIRSRQSIMSTVILTAPSESLCSALEIVCEDVVRTLTGLLGCPYVLPGEGDWQRRTAKMLHQSFSECASSAALRKGESSSMGTRGEVLRAAGVFASCLGACGDIMSGDTDTLDSSSRSLHSSGCSHANMGTVGVGDAAELSSTSGQARSWTAREHSRWSDEDSSRCELDEPWETDLIHFVKDVTSYDALVPNQNALQLAVDTAICVLDIDGHLFSCPQVIEKGLKRTVADLGGCSRTP